MTKDEAMRIALETLENNRYIIESEINPPEALEEVDVAITALRQALEQLPDTTKMMEPIIAGAVYDFAGFITTRNKVIGVGATADAAPVADLVEEWANRRSLSLKNAAIGSWEKTLAEPPNSTTDVVESEPVAWIGEAPSGYRELDWDKADLQRDYPFVYPLYAAPPSKPWVSLTNDEIDLFITLHAPPIHPDFNDDDDFIELVEAIEAKLKEKNT